MATVKKGMLTRTGKWWKHLRRIKRTFWKGERQAAKKQVAGRESLSADKGERRIGG